VKELLTGLAAPMVPVGVGPELPGHVVFAERFKFLGEDPIPGSLVRAAQLFVFLGCLGRF